MTMIQNNIPMAQVQRQKAENNEQAPVSMAAPQGTAFRGKEDEDKKTDWKKAALYTAAALGVAYVAKSLLHSDGGWNPFDGKWWGKGAENVAKDANKTVDQIKESANDVAVASRKGSALPAEHKKALAQFLEDNNAKSLKEIDIDGLQDRQSFKFGADNYVLKKSKYGTFTLAKADAVNTNKRGAGCKKFILNENGEHIGTKTYRTTNGLTKKTTQLYKEGSTDIATQIVNNGAGKAVGSLYKKVKAKGYTFSVQTVGKQAVLEELQKDYSASIYDSLKNGKAGKKLQEITGMKKGEYKQVFDDFIAKCGEGSALAPVQANEFINQYAGKQLTITKPTSDASKKLVQNFRADNGVIHQMSLLDANARTLTKMSNFSGNITDAMRANGDDKKQIQDIFDIGEDLSVTAKDSGYIIGDTDTYHIATGKKGQLGIEDGNSLSKDAELVLKSQEKVIDFDQRSLKGIGVADLSDGQVKVKTTYDFGEQLGDDSKLARDITPKGATVTKVDKDGKEVFKATIDQHKVGDLHKDVAKRDAMTINAMLEGNNLRATSSEDLASNAQTLLGSKTEMKKGKEYTEDYLKKALNVNKLTETEAKGSLLDPSAADALVEKSVRTVPQTRGGDRVITKTKYSKIEQQGDEITKRTFNTCEDTGIYFAPETPGKGGEPLFPRNDLYLEMEPKQTDIEAALNGKNPVILGKIKNDKGEPQSTIRLINGETISLQPSGGGKEVNYKFQKVEDGIIFTPAEAFTYTESGARSNPSVRFFVGTNKQIKPVHEGRKPSSCHPDKILYEELNLMFQDVNAGTRLYCGDALAKLQLMHDAVTSALKS